MARLDRHDRGPAARRLNQAIGQRRPAQRSGLIHHSDRGGQYLSLRYTARLAEAGIEMSVGSVGNSCDNTLAESAVGLFKTEVANLLGPWKTAGQIEWETPGWVHWHNRERLHSAVGNRPPDEAEDALRKQLDGLEKAA